MRNDEVPEGYQRMTCKHYLEQWKKRWAKRILSEREYFEDDPVPVQEQLKINFW